MANKTTLSKSLEQLADEVVYAQNTLSEYYTIGTIKVRYSDHMATDPDCDLALFSNTVNKRNVYIIIPTVGLFKEVQWFSKVEDVIDFIKRFESVARLLIKKPTPNTNKHERIMSNALGNISSSVEVEAHDVQPQEGPGKMSWIAWTKNLKFIYGTDKGSMDWMLIELYNLNGRQDMIERIRKSGPLPIEGKRAFLAKLLNEERAKVNVNNNDCD